MGTPFDRCPLATRYRHVTDAELRAWHKTHVHLGEQAVVSRRALKHALDQVETLRDRLEAAERRLEIMNAGTDGGECEECLAGGNLTITPLCPTCTNKRGEPVCHIHGECPHGYAGSIIEWRRRYEDAEGRVFTAEYERDSWIEECGDEEQRKRLKQDAESVLIRLRELEGEREP